MKRSELYKLSRAIDPNKPSILLEFQQKSYTKRLYNKKRNTGSRVATPTRVHSNFLLRTSLWRLLHHLDSLYDFHGSFLEFHRCRCPAHLAVRRIFRCCVNRARLLLLLGVVFGDVGAKTAHVLVELPRHDATAQVRVVYNNTNNAHWSATEHRNVNLVNIFLATH